MLLWVWHLERKDFLLCSWMNWMLLLWYVSYYDMFLTMLRLFTFLTMLRYLVCYVSYYDTFLWKLSLSSTLYEAFISLEILEKSWFGLNESCCASVPNSPLVWVSRDIFSRWHTLKRKVKWVGQYIGLWEIVWMI